jgi:carbon-monoxide dehydrogenase medium subunit
MSFAYFQPASLEESLSLLNEFKGRAKILAGGTDLALKLKRRLVRPGAVIDIGSLRALRGIRREEDGSLWIGALSAMEEIARSELLSGGSAALRRGASQVSSIQVRNMATLGGSVSLGVPWADTAPALVALGTRVFLRGPKGEREVEAKHFLEDRGKTGLKADELLMGFRIPPLPQHTEGTYLKYTPRGSFEWPLVGAAVILTCEPGDLRCLLARVVIGARGSGLFRSAGAESVLAGKAITKDLISRAAGEAAADGARVFGAGPDWYSLEMVKVWVKRAIAEAAAKFLPHSGDV